MTSSIPRLNRSEEIQDEIEDESDTLMQEIESLDKNDF